MKKSIIIIEKKLTDNELKKSCWIEDYRISFKTIKLAVLEVKKLKKELSAIEKKETKFRIVQKLT